MKGIIRKLLHAAPAANPAVEPKPRPLPSAPPPPRPQYDDDLARLGAAEEPPRSPRLFFIGGHPRSGTNWTSTLLNLHPHIYCTGEFTFHDILNVMPALVAGPHRAAFHEPVRTAAARAFQDFIRTTMRSLHARKPGATLIGDHTPRPIRVILPDASYLIINRDGRDVLVSWTFNALARRETHIVPRPMRAMFEQHLADCEIGGEIAMNDAALRLLEHEGWVRHWARMWSAHVRHDLNTARRIESGALGANCRVLSFRYEDLHADTVGTRARILSFLGVDPAKALPPSREDRTLPGFVKEDPKSHYRKGAVGDHLTRMTPAAVKWFEDAAGTELAEHQYPLREVAGALRPAPTAAAT